jgi:transcriptional regulator with PAS, ATPase and Fis domain
MIDVQNIKQQFDIIGSAPALDRGIDIAYQVAPTDLSVLITGESGTGKEVFPKIIHKFSARKHGQYIAVNCGAIPEGTIDSELFGHEKGSFTGALDTRKGYFEVVDGGTIFLDEVAELPLSTQVRLLRVLETGEFLKVGSSKMQKTNVRVIAATNVNLQEAIKRNRFREDLYYRLNTVPIIVPPLRERKEDIYLLFRKFASDFAEKYRMPSITLDSEARLELENYPWPGNVRQLKNVTEQISVIEHDRDVTKDKLSKYLPVNNSLPVLYQSNDDVNSFASERELLYKILFDMRNDVNELKKWMYKLSKGESAVQEYSKYVDPEPLIYQADEDTLREDVKVVEKVQDLQSQEKEAIQKVLKQFNNKRKPAANALGISERTLYRKIKEYDIEEYENE